MAQKHHKIISKYPATACAVYTCHTAGPSVVAIADRGRVFWSGPNLPPLPVKPQTELSAEIMGCQTIDGTDV